MRTVFCGFALVVLCACQNEPGAEDDFFNQGQLRAFEGANALQELESELVAQVEGARERVWVAVEGLRSEALARALVLAHGRGVEVRVVVDADRLGDSALETLREALGGSSRFMVTGQALVYSPEPARTLERDSLMNRMSHNVLLSDRLYVTTWTAPLGDPVETQWVFQVRSMDLAKDFEDELNQLFGGVSATTLSFFDGPLKSNTNNRVRYPMAHGVWELYFGPQERLIKRVLDEVYAARSSVRIVTPSLDNTFLLDALAYKARVGKQVEVTVERAFMSDERGDGDNPRAASGTGTASGAKTASSGAAKGQGAALKALSEASDSFLLGTLERIAGTVVLIDASPLPNAGKHTARGLVLSHELVESVPFDANDVSVPADAFMDGHMWVLTENSGRLDPDLRELVRSVQRAQGKGGTR